MRLAKRFVPSTFLFLCIFIGFFVASMSGAVEDYSPDTLQLPGAYAEDDIQESVPEPEPEVQPKPVVDPSKPMVALTFDDGPGLATAKILDILEVYGARATFCVVGYLLEGSEELIRRAVEQGSEIASHTWRHSSLVLMSEEELLDDIAAVSGAVYDIAGVYPALVRPPYGRYDSDVREALAGQDMALLYWSIDPRDWDTQDADSTYELIMSEVTDGSIIICHDSQPSTAAAMARVIPKLIEMGYQLVTASELLEYKEGGAVPGEVYFGKTMKD